MKLVEIFPPERAVAIQSRIERSLDYVYRVNAGRHDAEGLGDDNHSFAFTVRPNLSHKLEAEFADLEGVKISRAGQAFVIHLEEGFSIEFYKAAPGASGVDSFKFDGSNRKKSIIRENGVQLTLNLDGAAGEEPLPSLMLLSRRLVVVHFGDPEHGYLTATIGAPYLDENDRTQWAWTDELRGSVSDGLSTVSSDAASHEPSLPELADADDDLGLRILPAEKRRGDGEHDA